MKKLILALILFFTFTCTVFALTCPKCNQYNTEGSKFCISCGSKLAQSVPAVQTAPAPVMPKRVEQKQEPAPIVKPPVKKIEKTITEPDFESEEKSAFGLGLNYTGIHFKISQFELKYQVADETKLMGIRKYFGEDFYPGIELGYISYNPVAGLEAGVFLGFQKRFGNLAVFADIGYYLIYTYNPEVEDSKAYSDSGMIINSGITYYIF